MTAPPASTTRNVRRRIEYASLVYRDGQPTENLDDLIWHTSPTIAESRRDYHLRKSAEDPAWIGEARVLRRAVLTTEPQEVNLDPNRAQPDSAVSAPDDEQLEPCTTATQTLCHWSRDLKQGCGAGREGTTLCGLDAIDQTAANDAAANIRDIAWDLQPCSGCAAVIAAGYEVAP